MVTPSYAFETPVLGGQFELGVTVLAGNYNSTLSTTFVPPGGPAQSDATKDSMTRWGTCFRRPR